MTDAAHPAVPWADALDGVEDVDPRILLPHPQNFRAHPERQRSAYRDTVRDVGYLQRVVVNRETGRIIDGHLRWEEAIASGWETLPVQWVRLSEEKELAALAMFDPLGAMAEADAAAHAAVIDQVRGSDVALAALMNHLVADAPSQEDSPPPEDTVPPLPADPVTRRGDLWMIGPHRIACGDCRVPEDVARLMGDAKAAVVVTSPPYAAQRDYDRSSGFAPIKPAAYGEWFDAVQAGIAAVLAPGGSFFLNIKPHSEDGQRSLYVVDLLLRLVRTHGWRFVDEFCWRNTRNGVPGSWGNRFKNAWEPVYHLTHDVRITFRPRNVEGDAVEDRAHDMTRRGKKEVTGSNFTDRPRIRVEGGSALPSNVIDVAAENGAPQHSAPFPRDLPLFFTRAFSDPGAVVYDPFVGSGTTVVAAADANRVGFGIDLSPAYVDVAVARVAKRLGVEPVRIAT